MWVARWNNTVIAKSDKCIDVEGNRYFPRTDVNMVFLVKSKMTSVCPWKGVASYFDVVINKEVNRDAAWTYKSPQEDAKNIKGYIAFWKDILITKK